MVRSHRLDKINLNTMQNTIRADERIFQVNNLDGNKYLVNLDAFSISEAGELLAYGESIKSIKHYWNHKFEVIYKEQVKTMVQSK